MFCCTYSANSAILLTYSYRYSENVYRLSDEQRTVSSALLLYQYHEVMQCIPQPLIHYGTINLHTITDKIYLFICYCAVPQCSHIVHMLIKCCDHKKLIIDRNRKIAHRNRSSRQTIDLIRKHIRYKQTHEIQYLHYTLTVQNKIYILDCQVTSFVLKFCDS